jgi:hypothetical protein
LDNTDEAILYNSIFIIERFAKNGCIELEDGDPNLYLSILEKDETIK